MVTVTALLDLAVAGQPLMRAPAAELPATPDAHLLQAWTRRGHAEGGRVQVRAEGLGLRYSAMVALGAARLPDPTTALGASPQALAEACAQAAIGRADLGIVSLAAWAQGELGLPIEPALAARLRAGAGEPVDTGVASWALCAALTPAAAAAGLTETVAVLRRRLLAEQGPAGYFPHTLPPRGALRGHVGCFADQVYPIQALARLATRGDDEARAAATRCADAIVAAQGDAGQWWWHYDVRAADAVAGVVEGYPVYSVHQHAMAPMALHELTEAGGPDHAAAIRLGLDWLAHRPETDADLISPTHQVIWRKVARREVAKVARRAAAVATAVAPGTRLPGLDLVAPPGVVDRECRPYEFGWMYYAWYDAQGRPRW